ncbi:uncharacterized protein LTR77_001015 [Saxophila tyrrhenica]|uniref:Uncharacterized protein n=1 Tax=Saxophila tyrrhenica TaxID=1690608 RepID=A0AAV9PQX4_9PEZI|nr:hypothetical protein LTR77_001015 [Saxophila tyrrhenica]
MGIHGLFAQIGHGQRISLAKLSAQYYTTNNRPFRLAIDISIWLFQIQSGKGGSNPALRTFYYRLLRLLSLNIHPLFVFDGPNKPLFKRNKKVGGPGVRVASVPEFLAKQLLKQFGYPWHVAPGEAEAECALLQREGIVDAVLSEDVDTLMFGSGVTLRNWTAENTTKTPTHVDVHRADETKSKSGLDPNGMILVALMSGGDYLPEGIPGCGPKLACDAARAGFGNDLCALGRKDAAGLDGWRDRLRHEVKTNESKLFKRRNASLVIPDDFPNREVLGFYTHPCVSTAEKLARLRQELKWDQPMDFAALRSFAGDAFDWRCIGGAKKFIKNLAPALLIREFRLRGAAVEQLELGAQEEREHEMILAIHGQRNHKTLDGELEYRISFVPEKFVPIDLSIEDEDDEIVPAGGPEDDTSDAESDFMQLPSSTQDENGEEAPKSPKKRNFKPYDPSQPEKLWIQRTFLQIGCPLLVEDFESTSKDPKEFLKQRRQARAVGKGSLNMHSAKPRAKKSKAKANDMPANAIMNYARVTKPGSGRQPKDKSQDPMPSSLNGASGSEGLSEKEFAAVATFKLPSTQIPADLYLPASNRAGASETVEVLDLAMSSPAAVRPKAHQDTSSAHSSSAAALAPRNANASRNAPSQGRDIEMEKTLKRTNKKRPPPDFSSPALSQRTIFSYYPPSPRKPKEVVARQEPDIVDLLSSPTINRSPLHKAPSDFGSAGSRPLTPTPPNIRSQFVRTATTIADPELDYSPGKLPDTVTKRRKKGALKRWQTEPAIGPTDDGDGLFVSPARPSTPSGLAGGFGRPIEIDSPASDDGDLASPSAFLRPHRGSTDVGGGFLLPDEDGDLTPRPVHRHSADLVPAAQPEVEERASQSHPPPLPDLDDDEEELPPILELPAREITAKPTTSMPSHSAPSARRSPRAQASATQPIRKSPRQHVLKKRIHLRESLEGSWKTVDAEAIDMTGDGSGWKNSGGKAKLQGWRKSGVEVLDLTGA